ncbi:MAG TPA: bifunctional aspartate kinase/homoserine dehydrogenase I [Melioribacteraceae bacterium]|nr:bifunctional aspartate kinase/homoserine dehydrogenase I [Melioribacteraceae bacterium]
MKVLKFGGSSVGSADRIADVGSIIKNKLKNNEKIAVVFSAFQGVTDLLIEIGLTASKGDISYKTNFNILVEKTKEIVTKLIKKNTKKIQYQVEIFLNEIKDLLHGIYLIKEISPKTMDNLLSYGERISNYAISEYFITLGINANYCDAREIIKTDSLFGSAKVNLEISEKLIKNYFEKSNKVEIITGFIASNNLNETTTLGRGGSDYTASIIGAALNVEEIEIWTDVDGVLTADPRKVKDAFPVSFLSYEEAMELSHFGAKVIHPPTMYPAMVKNIPIRIKNTFNPNFIGTLVQSSSTKDKYAIKGISSIDEVALISVQGPGMVGVAGIAKRLFGVLANEGINIILITQASSEHSICFAVLPKFAEKAQEVIRNEFYYELKDGLVNDIKIESELSIVAVVGENMRSTAGIAGNLFLALGDEKINIVAIAQGSSELNISMVINKTDLKNALNLIHKKFFFNGVKDVYLFVAGIGKIGNKFIEILINRKEYLLKQKNIRLNLIGVSNSKKMIWSIEGINDKDLGSNFNFIAKNYTDNKFVEQIINSKLKNKIFVDCTSGKELAKEYLNLLKNKVSIVTANKTANSIDYNYYQKLLELQKNKTFFNYEATVGAGLPILTSLNDLKNAGDEIEEIEAVLSGTLGYIFNIISKDVPLSKAIKKASKKGFSEPDPRDDLSGFDVLRKIIILIRELGIVIEPNAIEQEKIIDNELLFDCTLDDFYNNLSEVDKEYENKRLQSESKNERLKYIAEYKNGKAKIGIKSIGPNSPFYNLCLTDNMVVIKSKYYNNNPLIIQGPGAGLEVTAAAVFADLIKIIDKI